ncbi:Uncharacterized protein GBIM_13984, partial [Gryllus bimaculatus]
MQQLAGATPPQPEVHALVTTNTWLSGFLTVMVALSAGSPLVVFRRFDVDELLGSVSPHGITNLYLAPAQVAAIAKSRGAERHDVSALRSATFSGAPLSPALQAQAAQTLRCPVVRLYGLTESLLLVFPGPKSREKPGSVGKVSINVQMK